MGMEAPALANQENLGSLTFVDLSDKEKFRVLYEREGNERLDGIKDILSVNFVDQFKARETLPSAPDVKKEIAAYINKYRPFDLTPKEAIASLQVENPSEGEFKNGGLITGAANNSQQRFIQSLVEDVIRDLGITEE